MSAHFYSVFLSDKQADASFYMGEILMGLGGKVKADAVLGSDELAELADASQSDVMILVSWLILS